MAPCLKSSASFSFRPYISRMGEGRGTGTGQGGGSGESTGENVAIGAGVAVGLTVIMCIFGFPMMIAGAVLTGLP